MAYGVTKERKLQIGLESSAGTAVAATAIFRGPAASIVDEQGLVYPNEDVGYASQEDRAYTPSARAMYAQPETEATFEQFPVILSASVANVVSGSATGSTPAGYSYSHATPSVSSSATIKTYTLEAGNNAAAYRTEYGFVTDWTLKGAQNEALKFSANWRGRQKASNAFTAALTPISVEEILFNKGKLYYDALGGTIGTTQKTGSWLGFTLKHVSGWKAIATGDGNLYFSTAVFKGAQITGDITVEDETFAAAIRTAQAAGTTGLMRWLFEGSTIGTGGTYQKKTFRADLAVKWDQVPAADSQDDDDVYTFPFTVVRTSSVYATYLTVNALSAIAS